MLLPVAFHVVSNQIFAVGAYDYGCYRFDHWSDTGSTARFRNILITSNTTLTVSTETSANHYNKATQVSMSIPSIAPVEHYTDITQHYGRTEQF